jgi:hypothetical protein
VTAAILFIRHRFLVRRVGFHIVERGDRLRGVAKRWVSSDIVHPFAAEVDYPPITQRLQMLFAGL